MVKKRKTHLCGSFVIKGDDAFDLLRLFAPAPATNPSGTYLPYRDKYEAAVIEKSTVTDFIEKS